MAQEPKGIDQRHMLLFGTIIQRFAAHEWLIARIAAHMLSTEPQDILIMMRDLCFEERRKALLDLLRHRDVPLDRYDRVNGFLSFLLPFARLRYDIIHAVWTAAPSPKMLQPDWLLRPVPRIAPIYALGDTLPGGAIEDAGQDLAYSLDELEQIAGELTTNLANFSDYLAANGLIG